MGKKTMRRISAFAMAAVIAMTGVVGYGGKPGDGMAFSRAEGMEDVLFAEGEGTGKDFSASSWVLSGTAYNTATKAKWTITEDGKKPAIVTDTLYRPAKSEKVIRLINGVKSKTGSEVGLEAGDSYTDYRSGEAFLSAPKKLGENGEFSIKFTFSMPEAVVNPSQTGGTQYAREVGGDGIAFVMTTDATHTVQAGSGIGYQGIQNSISVELDSYFNGAYCMMTSDDYAYQNWGFDNQLYFHAGEYVRDGSSNYSNNANPYEEGYENYENPGFKERFDHVAITLDGNVKTHIGDPYYLNGLNPAELVDGEYVNLANRYKRTNTTTPKTLPRSTGSTYESVSPTCTTRFADKGVNDRLFTVWLDCDGESMEVRIANGDFTSAEKPETPQVTYRGSDFKNKIQSFANASGGVHMGFTSAVGSSKANHTIHSFSFAVPAEKAQYKIVYKKWNVNTNSYEVADETEIRMGKLGSKVNVEEEAPNYRGKYTAGDYEVNTAKNEDYSKELEDTNRVYELIVYYDPIKAPYRTEYYLKQPDGSYKKQENDTVDGGDTFVGTPVEAVIKGYEGYQHVSIPGKSEESGIVQKRDSAGNPTTVLKVYYDPVQEQTGKYIVKYFKWNDTEKAYKLEDQTQERNVPLGTSMDLETADPLYRTKYEANDYEVNEGKNEKYSVTVENADITYELEVYYDPVKAPYRTEYYLRQPDGTYEKQENDTKESAPVNVGTQVEAQEKKYPGYKKVETPDSNETDTVKRVDGNGEPTTILKVYYDPVEVPKVKYKVEYYKLDAATGEYQFVGEDPVQTGDLNEIVRVATAAPGYKTKYQADDYEVNEDKNDDYVKTLSVAEQTYVLKVYYDPIKAPYRTEYYLKQPDGSYLKKDVEDGEKTYIGTTVTAPEKDYPGYEKVTTPETKETDTVKKADLTGNPTTILKVYYAPTETEKAKYRIEYYTKNLQTGEYDLMEKGKEQIAEVNTQVTVANVDPVYETKYEANGYAVNTAKNEDYTKTLSDAGEVYVLKVYYDPVKAPYRTEYYLKQPDGTYVKQENDTIISAPVNVGTQVEAPDKTYPGYKKVETPDSNETDTVKRADGNGEPTTILKVYYDPVVPAKANYKVEYYKLDPNTNQYIKADSTSEVTDDVGTRVHVRDVDSGYKDKYDDYEVNTSKQEDYSVTLEQEGNTYVMKVYYVPRKVPYRTEHYLKQPDGSYTLRDTVQSEPTYTGKNVNAVEKDYPGYTHVKIPDSVEKAVVEGDGTTTLKVYYDPDAEVVTPAYQLLYYKWNPNTHKYEYVTATPAIKGEMNKTYYPADADPDYKNKYLSDGYTFKETADAPVTMEDSDKIYQMIARYYPEKAPYKTEYYQKQPDGTFKLVEIKESEQPVEVDTKVEAQQKDYQGFQYVVTEDTKTVAYVEPDGTTTMKLYYEPSKPQYTVEYYIQKPDGSYVLYRDPTVLVADAGSTVSAEIIGISGYVHIITSNTKETGTVAEDSSTVLKVYYKLAEQQATTQTPSTTQPPTTTEENGYEEEDDGEDDEEEDDDEDTEEKKKTSNSAKTGDGTNPGFVFLLMVSAVAGGTVCRYIRKKENE